VHISVGTLRNAMPNNTLNTDCVFRPMSATDSAACRPPIPRHAGRGFRGMSAPLH
jgi:hypothetical protein